MSEAVDDLLRQRWLHMCDDAGAAPTAAMHAVIKFAYDTGLLDCVRAELWMRRVSTCPGHDDGTRSWCAYCGDVSHD